MAKPSDWPMVPSSRPVLVQPTPKKTPLLRLALGSAVSMRRVPGREVRRAVSVSLELARRVVPRVRLVTSAEELGRGVVGVASLAAVLLPVPLVPSAPSAA